MKSKSLVICFIASLIFGGAFQQTVGAKTLFWDDFKDGKISKAYVLVGCDKWVEKDGIFQQPDLGIPRDPCHAIIVEPADYPEEITIQALVRMDVWKGGDFARAGLTEAERAELAALIKERCRYEEAAIEASTRRREEENACLEAQVQQVEAQNSALEALEQAVAKAERHLSSL